MFGIARSHLTFTYNRCQIHSCCVSVYSSPRCQCTWSNSTYTGLNYRKFYYFFAKTFRSQKLYKKYFAQKKFLPILREIFPKKTTLNFGFYYVRISNREASRLFKFFAFFWPKSNKFLDLNQNLEPFFLLCSKTNIF